jgi:hypothetical protein
MCSMASAWETCRRSTVPGTYIWHRRSPNQVHLVSCMLNAVALGELGAYVAQNPLVGSGFVLRIGGGAWVDDITGYTATRCVTIRRRGFGMVC